jgi:hypothetical protein
MKPIKNIYYWFLVWMQRRKMAKRIKELKKRDPFIYK